jgi:hypothetical protein
MFNPTCGSSAPGNARPTPLLRVLRRAGDYAAGQSSATSTWTQSANMSGGSSMPAKSFGWTPVGRGGALMTAAAFIILNFKAFEKNSLRGFFDVEPPSGMILSGCTLHESHGKFWVALPARPYAKADGSQSWVKIVDFRDKAPGYRFQQMIVPLAVEVFERAKAEAAA